MGVFLAQGYALEPTQGHGRSFGLASLGFGMAQSSIFISTGTGLIDYFQTSAKASIQYREIISQYSYMLLVTV